jgi:hypothetical protein
LILLLDPPHLQAVLDGGLDAFMNACLRLKGKQEQEMELQGS